jgi:hypothetical protein
MRVKGGPQKSSKKKKRKKQKKTAGNSEVDSHPCAECWENYYTPMRKDDWIRCLKCLHGNCSVYAGKCTYCRREKNVKK